jgi:uncharacterized membrane protein YfcA
VLCKESAVDFALPPIDLLLLTGCLLAASVLYSMSGHGGATAYLALFGLFGLPPGLMRAIALVLNVVVAGLGSVRLWRAGVMPWRTLGILLAGSIPGTFVGGLVNLPATTYRGLLGALLLVASARLIVPTRAAIDRPLRQIAPAVLLLIGLVLGVLSGLTGIGGGIFLSPILILSRMEDPRRTAAAAAAFIVVNSATGLVALGMRGALVALPTVTVLFAAVVLAGGALGSWLAAGRLSFRGLRVALGVVLLFSGAKLLSEAIPNTVPAGALAPTTTTAPALTTTRP